MIYTLDENGEVQFDLVIDNKKATSRLFKNFKIETENMLLMASHLNIHIPPLFSSCFISFTVC